MNDKKKYFCASWCCPGLPWKASDQPHPPSCGHSTQDFSSKDLVRSILITRTAKDQFQVQYCSDFGTTAHPLQSFDSLGEVAEWLKGMDERII
jgi:hypothetical protein